MAVLGFIFDVGDKGHGVIKYDIVEKSFKFNFHRVSSFYKRCLECFRQSYLFQVERENIYLVGESYIISLVFLLLLKLSSKCFLQEITTIKRKKNEGRIKELEQEVSKDAARND